jgi:hypothetical protein
LRLLRKRRAKASICWLKKHCVSASGLERYIQKLIS